MLYNWLRKSGEAERQRSKKTEKGEKAEAKKRRSRKAKKYGKKEKQEQPGRKSDKKSPNGMEQNNEISASPLITIDLLHPFSTPFFTGNIMDKIKTHQGGIIISIYWYRWYCIPFTIYLPRV